VKLPSFEALCIVTNRVALALWGEVLPCYFKSFFGKEILGWKVSYMNSDPGNESLVGPLLHKRHKQAPLLNAPTYMLSLKNSDCPTV